MLWAICIFHNSESFYTGVRKRKPAGDGVELIALVGVSWVIVVPFHANYQPQRSQEDFCSVLQKTYDLSMTGNTSHLALWFEMSFYYREPQPAASHEGSHEPWSYVDSTVSVATRRNAGSAGTFGLRVDALCFCSFALEGNSFWTYEHEIEPVMRNKSFNYFTT